MPLLQGPAMSPSILVAVAVLASLALVGAASYVLLGWRVAQRYSRASRTAPRPQRTGSGQALDEVSFPARDGRARIDAWYLPAAFRRGAVIVVHGQDGCRGDGAGQPSLSLASRLVDRGLSVLLIDLRGHGSSSDAPLTYSEHERHDVLGAVDWLRAQGYAAGRIGVIGMGLGASAAMRAAAADPAIGAVVADSPFADAGVVLRRRLRAAAGLPGWLLPVVLWACRWRSGVDVARVRPLSEMAALAGRPVLVIHGGADPVIPLEEGRAMAEASAAVLWVTPSCRHLGSSVEAPEIYGDVVGIFLAGHLLDEGLLDMPAANEGLVDWAESDAA